MTTNAPGPPRLAEWVLRIVVEKADYPHVSGDLLEEFAEWAVPTLGSTRARRWYWQQVLHFLRQAFVDGMRAGLDFRALTSGVGQDITSAIRMLRTAPASAIVLLTTLALGIGANAAMFSVAHALLLRPFPFPDPDRLVQVSSLIGENTGRLSVREVADLNERTQLFEGFAGYAYTRYNFNGNGGRPENFIVTRTTHQLFDILGVQLAQGQPWAAIYDRSRSFEIILSHDLWMRRFAADPAIVGQSVLMDGYPNRIAGVLPPGIGFPGREAVYRTWGIASNPLIYEDRRRREVLAVGRLKSGVTFAQAEAELAAVSRQLAEEAPDTNSGFRFVLRPLRDAYVGNVRPYLILLTLAVGLVLLMACVNVTSLLLARATGRDREMATRAALGAGRFRLIRQSLVESLVLAAVGGALGLALAHAGTMVTTRLVRAELPPWMDIRTDLSVLGFVLVVSMATALLAGILPAVKQTRGRLVARLNEGTRGAAGASRLRNGLVMAQVAFALTLLAGAGLLLQSFERLRAVELGFRPERLLTFHVGLSWNKYGLEKARQFHEGVLDGLRALPDVEDAFVNTALPVASSPATSSVAASVALRHQATERERRQNPLVSFQQVTPTYHKGMGIPLIRGRLFEPRDNDSPMPVALVSEALAERLWPNRDPIGEQVLPDDLSGLKRDWFTVVGIVGNVKQDSLASADALTLYVPIGQAGLQSFDFAVRTSGDPRLLAPLIPRVVAAVDPEEPFSRLATMEELVADSVWQRSLATRLFTTFGALALALACAGLYGVVAYNVARRQREIGIRSALGAQRQDVLRLILRDGLALVLPGLAAGGVCAVLAGRAMSGLLFEVDPADAGTVAIAAGVLLLATLAACLIPARRAAALDPLVALRHE
jgi:predicted permease